MLIVADHRIPETALLNLKYYGKVISFETSTITYDAISGHPDIFFCMTKNGLVVAPNIPLNTKNQLTNSNISVVTGGKDVGAKYPQSAFYNAVITENYLIHNLKQTDPVILDNCNHLTKLHVNQAYSRCSTIALKNDRFITSDKGIEKTLLSEGLETLFVNPSGILLPGFNHGFFGGSCSVVKNQIFFIGSLDHFPEGEKVRQFLSGYEIVELYDGPLFDGGSLLFLE